VQLIIIATMLHLTMCPHIMSVVIRGSIQILRTRGYKITKPRKLVLEVLGRAQRPVSPYDIQEILRQRGKNLNHVTIYRILDLFCHLNLAHRVSSSGRFVRCSLGKGEGCHRLMVCRQCGAIQEFIDRRLCREESELAQNSGFHTEYHLSESSGICANCYKKK